MRAGLQGVRRRVEALERVLMPSCAGLHRFYRVCNLEGGRDELPPWPEAEQPTCRCGQPRRFFQIVNCLQPEASVQGAQW